MRFRTRTIVLAALAAVFVGLLGATAFAGEADVSGQGWLAARGKGSVTVDRGGTFRMEVAGDVEIRDLAGDMTVRIDGAATRSTGGPRPRVRPPGRPGRLQDPRRGTPPVERRRGGRTGRLSRGAWGSAGPGQSPKGGPAGPFRTTAFHTVS